MANVFKSHTVDGITSKTNFTTVGSGKAHVVIGLQVANVGATTATVNAYLLDASASSAEIYIVKSVPVPVGASLSLLDGKIIAETTDQVFLTSDIAVDGILSVLEQDV